MNEKKILKYGSAKAEPGEKGTGFVKVGELSDNSPIYMPVIILNGKNLGPRLLLIGLEDGDEYPGTIGALDAINNILPKVLNQMKGSVVFLPAVNISAFRGNQYGGGIRNSPLNIDQGHHLTSSYPGNPYGHHTQQLAYQITKIKSEYDPDAIIKFHGCKQIFGIDRIWCWSAPIGSKHDNFWRSGVTNPETMIILGHNRADRGLPPLPERPLEMNLESNGGENGIGNGLSGGAMRDSLLNVMKHLKMIPGKEIKVDKIQYVEYKSNLGSGGYISSSGINSTRGGFFKPLVKIMEKVEEGQIIGEIINFFGEVVEEIKSPLEGFIIGYYCESPHIGSGQWRLFEIAVPTELR